MGIGQKLISFLIEETRKEGKQQIFLWVLADNTSARNFYEKSGFLADGQQMLVPGTNVLDVRYVKTL